MEPSLSSLLLSLGCPLAFRIIDAPDEAATMRRRSPLSALGISLSLSFLSSLPILYVPLSLLRTLTERSRRVGEARPRLPPQLARASKVCSYVP